jgi:hypothetical protein
MYCHDVISFMKLICALLDALNVYLAVIKCYYFHDIDDTILHGDYSSLNKQYKYGQDNSLKF